MDLLNPAFGKIDFANLMEAFRPVPPPLSGIRAGFFELARKAYGEDDHVRRGLEDLTPLLRFFVVEGGDIASAVLKPSDMSDATRAELVELGVKYQIVSPKPDPHRHPSLLQRCAGKDDITLDMLALCFPVKTALAYFRVLREQGIDAKSARIKLIGSEHAYPLFGRYENIAIPALLARYRWELKDDDYDEMMRYGPSVTVEVVVCSATSIPPSTEDILSFLEETEWPKYDQKIHSGEFEIEGTQYGIEVPIEDCAEIIKSAAESQYGKLGDVHLKAE